jgi:Domain of unknown function (DUF5664)
VTRKRTTKAQAEYPNGTAEAARPFTSQAGRKYDQDKPRYDLIQTKAIGAYVRVLTYGAEKYAPDNWRRVEDRRRRYFAAALRHLMSWWGGEQRDPETGENHLAHAICCVAFLLEEEEEGPEEDM